MSSCIFDGIKKARNDADEIYVSGPHLEKLQKFADKKAKITTSNIEAVKESDIIFLGVKPQMLTAVLKELKDNRIDFSEKILVSMAAGFKIASIRRLTDAPYIVRIMPNTPAKIGLGITGIYFEKGIDDKDKELISSLLAPLGMLCQLNSEEGINAIGALAGSAPAFLYRFFEAVEHECVRYGFSQSDARKIVEQLGLGTSSMVIHNHATSISSLREAVTSKGGTTYEGLQQMTSFKFEEMMEEVFKACMKKTHLFEEMF